MSARNLLVATLAGACLVAGVATAAWASVPVPTLTTAPTPTSTSTSTSTSPAPSTTPTTTDPVCESCECSSDEAPALPTLAGSAFRVANASFARLPVDKGKKVCVVVTVQGDDDDPKNPGVSVALDPNDRGQLPTVRTAKADPAKKQYVIELNIYQPPSFTRCTFARYGQGSVPAQATLEFNENLDKATLTSDGFKFSSADKFSVRFTCYRP